MAKSSYFSLPPQILTQLTKNVIKNYFISTSGKTFLTGSIKLSDSDFQIFYHFLFILTCYSVPFCRWMSTKIPTGGATFLTPFNAHVNWSSCLIECKRLRDEAHYDVTGIRMTSLYTSKCQCIVGSRERSLRLGCIIQGDSKY